MGEAFQRRQGKEGFFYLPFFSLFLSSWMRVQTVRSEQHLQARFAMLAARMHVCYCCTHTARGSTYEKEGKSNNKECETFRGGGKIPCLVYRNGREGTDEWEGREFIFEKSGNKTCGGWAENKTECENAESSSHKTNPLFLCQEDERRGALYCFTRMWGKSIPQTLSGILLYWGKREFWWRVVCCLGSKYSN